MKDRILLTMAIVAALMIGVATPALAQNRTMPGNEDLPDPADPVIPPNSVPGALDTGYIFNSGWCGGPFIDLTAGAQPITVTGFDMYFKGTVNRDVNVYWKAGSYSGSETTPGDWTLIGTVNVTPGGDGTPTAVALGGVVIPAGQTYGFKVWDGGTGPSDGPGLDLRSGGTIAADGNLALLSDRYSCFAEWDAPFTNWGWQGIVYYETGDPVPTLSRWAMSLLLVALVVMLTGVVVRRRYRSA